MSEQVQTGGLQTFAYKKGYHPQASQEEKDEIEAAYEAANERKKREKRKRLLLWILLIISIVLITIGLFWRTNK
jgi:cytoskeletal protein RodZ